MASKLGVNDISEITRQSDVLSKPVRDNFTNLKNKTNELVDEIAAAAIGTTNAETTAARPYNTNLKERLDQVWDGQYNYLNSGGVVTINVGDSQKVDVTAATGTIDGIQVKISAATSATIDYTSANTRYDVVVANSDSTFTVVTGAESATPVLPTIATTQRPIEVLTVGTATVALAWDARSQGCYYHYQGRVAYEWKIQDAIDALSSGGNIYVGPGTYLETLTYDDNQTITFDGGVTLKNAAGTTLLFEDINLSAKTNSSIYYGEGFVVPKALKREVFTANGTWHRPASVTTVRIIAIGGGGGGGNGNNSSNSTGGGGGAAGMYIDSIVDASSFDDYTIVIGSGGAASADGGDTYIVKDGGGAGILYARGGNAGAEGDGATTGGVGGDGKGYGVGTGGAGDGSAGGTGSGGGGGNWTGSANAGGASGYGINGLTSSGGSAGTYSGGGGGAGGTGGVLGTSIGTGGAGGTDANGTNGSGYGAGGGGAAGQTGLTGGTGSDGVLVIEYNFN
jgi:hypothetical protein